MKKQGSSTRRKQEGSPQNETAQRKQSDEVRHLALFLLGREDLTASEKEDIVKSKAEKSLLEMLNQKQEMSAEQSEKYWWRLKAEMGKA